MIKLVDLTFYAHLNYNHPEDVLENHSAALAFASHIDNRLDFCFVKHAGFEQRAVMGGVPYQFFRAGNNFWSVSFKTLRFVRNLKPDIVLVQGFIFPLQVMLLRLFCGSSTKIIVQHHGDITYQGIKGWLQKIAYRHAAAYIFTAKENAAIWQQRGIIKANAQIFELLEASTGFERQDKQISKSLTGINGKTNFLWVGRLNANKDPLAVLDGFERYLKVNPLAKLYMIYQTEELLTEVNHKINSSIALSNNVVTVGKVAPADLPNWYSAADFYISGSHREGSSYALLEAMACGCIPVVTAIPSFEKITHHGEYGFLYPPGDPEALANVLSALDGMNISKLSATTLTYFKQNLSFKVIADDLVDICETLMNK
ncbi:Glycosyltransferase involved in cell wall bisynthesis [Mucilaginibacter pineti]|uniref:Glycosyltransferase involved in cell wall bisynthesis n=1 Tax=Mucilaginibacter pineti TaxID=1391627 RepID=A0A1G6T8I2_9SPHI|nr:glycosyltransferase family 4 protein [Mucilaginibacter pineti]SDD25368.1 Glycosyltransferase involved in cell wall bisynthesis [Mucilaginibacter pineti]